MNWDLYKIFLAVASHGSLSAASRELGISPPTISRRIDQLEYKLDARLFNRQSDGYSLTQKGKDLIPLAENMETASAAIERLKPSLKETKEGTVRLATGYWLARFIIKHLNDFRDLHPSTNIEFVTSYSLADLNKRDADISIRNTRPSSGKLVMRKLIGVSYAIYGSKDYVLAHPEAMEESRFDGCDWIGGGPRLENLASQMWLSERLHKKPNLICSHTLQFLEGAKAGVGLAILPRFVGDEEDSLQRVSESILFQDRHVWLVVHEDLKKTPSVRAVMDWLVPLFKAERAKFLAD